MARSNPLQNPYTPKTERIPFLGNPSPRLSSATKDSMYYNVIPEMVKNEVSESKKVWLNKRGGFTAHSTVDAGGGVGRGIFYWPASGHVYTVIDSTLYRDTTSMDTLNTSTGTVWFTEFLASDGEQLLILCDGADMYQIETNDTVTEITDGDLPSAQATPVFFDSYLFIVSPNTPNIFNSDVDDPLAWDPTNFLSAEQYSDNVKALTRQVNYVVAFGDYSTEFFYDAANASGSPLARQESVSLKVGLAARDSVAQIDRRIFFVGQTQTGEPSVWYFEGLTGKEISNEFIRRILGAEGSNLTNATAWLCNHRGHTLYVLNLNARTLVYDCDEKVWVEWSINNASAHNVLPFKYATEGSNNTILVLHNTDGKVYELDPDTHTDDAGAILATVITERVDFNTNNWKALFGLALISDEQSTGSVTVDWSDDDYQNWSSSRTLDLTAGRAYTKAGGVFRRRAFRFRHTANAPFRAETMELDYQLRTS